MVFDKFKDSTEEVCPQCSIKCLGHRTPYNRTGLNVQVDSDGHAYWKYQQPWQNEILLRLRTAKGEHEGMLARATYPVRLEPIPKRARNLRH